MGAPLYFLNPDARILERIRNGDESALVTLYKSSRRAITAFVTQNSGTIDDAEDMLQDALVVLWERVQTGTFTYEAKLTTFLYSVVKNLWMRRLARKRRELPLMAQEEEIPHNESSVLESLADREDIQLVRQALDNLDEQCRQILLLFYWEEKTMEQIAQEMGFANSQTAKSKKYQCKKALQKLLAKDIHEPHR